MEISNTMVGCRTLIVMLFFTIGAGCLIGYIVNTSYHSTWFNETTCRVNEHVIYKPYVSKVHGARDKYKVIVLASWICTDDEKLERCEGPLRHVHEPFLSEDDAESYAKAEYMEDTEFSCVVSTSSKATENPNNTVMLQEPTYTAQLVSAIVFFALSFVVCCQPICDDIRLIREQRHRRRKVMHRRQKEDQQRANEQMGIKEQKAFNAAKAEAADDIITHAEKVKSEREATTDTSKAVKNKEETDGSLMESATSTKTGGNGVANLIGNSTATAGRGGRETADVPGTPMA